MKKVIVIGLIIILTIIVLYGTYSLFLKRTPEKVLKQVFNICLNGFDYSIESFKEQWHPNGDGKLLLIIKFNELSQENITYLKGLDNSKPLPISETEYWQMHPNEIPKQVLSSETGYYVFRTGRISNHELKKGIKMALDFYIFIIDTEKKMAVLYYSFM